MRQELKTQIQTMIEFIYSLSADVRVKHTDVIYEDEHANLQVYPPLTWAEQHCLELEDKIAEEVINVLINSGFLILVRLYTPEEQIAQARQKLAEVQRQTIKTTHFLAHAAALGVA